MAGIESRVKDLPTWFNGHVILYYQVNVEQWYKACKSDYCAALRQGDNPEELVCTATAAYSQLCAACGVIVQWRSGSLCREYPPSSV